MSNTAGHGARNLHERAQGFEHAYRLRKFQEECAEAIAAAARYASDPTEELAEAFAHELEGVRITLENLKPEWVELCRKVRPLQLQRFRRALERAGL